MRNKGPQGLPSGNIPDNDVLSILLVCQDGLAFFNLDRTSGPSSHVVLKRREFDELHERVRELLLFREGRPTPELNTLWVNGGEVGTAGGPLYEQLCPVGPIDDIFWGVALVVPEHSDLVTPEKGKLVTSAGIRQPRAQVFLLLEGLDRWSLVLFIDTSLTAIAVDIHQFVHGQGVLLIQGGTVQVLDCGDGLFGGLILDEGKSKLCKRTNISFIHSPVVISLQKSTYPSDIFLSLMGIKTASSEVWPTALSFLNKNFTSFCLLSSGTTGRPSMTIKVSRLSSSFTSYCALRSGEQKSGHVSQKRGTKGKNRSSAENLTHPRNQSLPPPPHGGPARTEYRNWAP